jgi:hypothetical protein
MNPQLEYVCEKCKKPIANGKGFVWLDMTDVRDYKRDLMEWIEKGRVGRPPLKPRWMAHHTGCRRVHEPIRSVRIESVRAERGLTRVTAALMEAMGDDLALTDWLDMLRFVAYGGGRSGWFDGTVR